MAGCLTIHSSRRRFAARLNSGVRRHMNVPLLTREEKVQTLRVLCELRPRALLELMEGESPYISDQSEGISNASREEGSSWVAALHHVRFAAEYGARHEPLFDGKHWLCAYPTEFEHWLEIGSPGVALADLSSYLADYPLPSESAGPP